MTQILLNDRGPNRIPLQEEGLTGVSFSRSIMRKLVTAEYDAEQNTLRLVEPLEGVRDHEKVQVEITRPSHPQPAWAALEGSLSKEAADDLQRAIDELFPPWE